VRETVVPAFPCRGAARDGNDARCLLHSADSQMKLADWHSLIDSKCAELTFRLGRHRLSPGIIEVKHQANSEPFERQPPEYVLHLFRAFSFAGRDEGEDQMAGLAGMCRCDDFSMGSHGVVPKQAPARQKSMRAVTRSGQINRKSAG
jgi:hypothetical protein